MSVLGDLTKRIEGVIIQSRLNAMATMLVTDRADRLKRIEQSLRRLKPGAYLIGTGPSTVGIYPLTVDEVVLGRRAMPGETSVDIVVDYEVNDTIYLAPHETSRAHAKIVRQPSATGVAFRLLDLGSTCGTFVNSEAIKDMDAGRVLASGDTIALGPTHTSTYVFAVITSTADHSDNS